MVEPVRLDPPGASGGQSVHLVGIAGDGMSALARLYLDAGWRVSGSDLAGGEKAAALAASGARIRIGHDPAHIAGAELVVHSPAIPRGNPELVAARAAGIPVQTRTRALTGLIAARETICVAGSHGKTTTTSMLSLILDRAGRQAGFMSGGPTVVLGNVTGRLGSAPLFVAETCEAFRALDHWQPQHCIVTNVDDEHSDHYGGRDRLEAAFADLVARVPPTGRIVLCGDDPFLARLAVETAARAIDYGLGEGRRLRAAGVTETASDSAFDVMLDGRKLTRVTLPVPGRHNVLNALGALGMALALGIDVPGAVEALAAFRPVRRRWQHLATARGVRVFDDFAHHPTEIAATLHVARRAADGGRVIVVLQPQLVSRVARLAGHYAQALKEADRIWLLPTDTSGEPGDPAAADHQLRHALTAHGIPYALAELALGGEAAICAALRAGDLVVAMGPAGARRFAERIVERLALDAQPAFSVLPHQVPGPSATLMHTAFERHAHARPDAPCAIQGRTVWSYARLDAEANRVAAALRMRQVKPDDLVALHMDKSLWLIAAMLGTLKAGAAFVPIDPRMTRPGLEMVLRRAGVVLTLTDHAETAQRAGLTVSSTLSEFLGELPKTAPAIPCEADPTALAYGMFTSGSTGVPRLVGVEHRNVVSVIGYSVAAFFSAADFGLVPTPASISFDASIYQIFTTLTMGGTLLVTQDLTDLVRSPHYSRLTMMGMTPTLLRVLLETTRIPPALRIVALGGEATPADLLVQLRSIPTLRQVRNYYGPAEATLYCLTTLLHDARVKEHSDAPAGTVIGLPIAGTHIHLVGPNGVDVPEGQPGELVVVGPGVSRGYLGEPEATAERFGVDPCDGGMRSYRTGDIARRLPDGRYEFLGRADDQIKLAGARIELGEVEAYLGACPGVLKAVALHLPHPKAGRRLVAFVVIEPTMDVGFIRKWLRERVPAVLIAQEILQIDAMPLQISGKIDRQALAQIWRDRALADIRYTDSSRSISDSLEERVLELWRHALKRPELRMGDDFFAAGGDSLAAMELVLTVEEEFGLRLKGELIDSLTSPGVMATALRGSLARALPSAAEAGKRHIDVILEQQGRYLTGWQGRRIKPDGLVVTLNPGGAGPGLVWCFQGYWEMTALASALGSDVPLHGMRSGYLIMDYTPDTIAALAAAYCDELEALQPTGPFHLGGNCQGASVARAIALELRSRGRQVERLILMEQAKFWYYDEPVELIYGEDSTLNPFRAGTDVELALARSYPGGVRVHLMPGGHGQFFFPPNIGPLAAIVSGVLCRAAERVG